ncbi:unnamed protein product [Nippostrongylus brasiliensis]|uniref:Recep_L_domain domain-containing protein n=1 Tax=Nippostrongylus brasiliensis TaxID=27835 RepID=A0A0N4Y303_NIPBR|nr:unnamed protein product [Nippostrongylus brasiliensis]
MEKMEIWAYFLPIASVPAYGAFGINPRILDGIIGRLTECSKLQKVRAIYHGILLFQNNSGFNELRLLDSLEIIDHPFAVGPVIRIIDNKHLIDTRLTALKKIVVPEDLAVFIEIRTPWPLPPVQVEHVMKIEIKKGKETFRNLTGRHFYVGECQRGPVGSVTTSQDFGTAGMKCDHFIGTVVITGKVSALTGLKSIRGCLLIDNVNATNVGLPHLRNITKVEGHCVMNYSLVIINNEKLDVIGFGGDFSLDRVESYLIKPVKPDGKAPFFYPMHGFPNMSNGPEDCILIDNVIKTRTHKCNKLYGIVRYSKDVVRLMQRGPVEIYGQFVIENTELTDLDIVVDNEVKIYGFFVPSLLIRRNWKLSSLYPALTKFKIVGAQPQIRLENIDNVCHQGADRIELDKFLNKSAGQLITYPDDCLPSCDGVTVDNIDTVVLRKINCSVINGELTVKNINCLLLTTILLGSFAFLGYGVAFFMYHTSEKRRIRNRVVVSERRFID